MREIKINYIFVLLVIALVGEAGLLFYFYYESNLQSAKLAELETSLNAKIDMNDQETQSNINTLSNAIAFVSSAQTDLKTQVSQIKATSSADFSGIIEDNLKGVVTIKTNVAQGTGFLITNDGYIVTNAHVIAGASYATIITSDLKQYSSDLVGYNTDIDIALLKISGSFDSLKFGDSSDVKVGEKVLAIGNPLGLSFTATEGIISARDREGINGLDYYFQTDVSLNPGNSGGPLINTQGKVIGINNFKISGAENIGFALESDHAVDAINDISQQFLNATLV